MNRDFIRKARRMERRTRRLEQERLRSLRQSRRGILTPYARAQIATITAAQAATAITRAGRRGPALTRRGAWLLAAAIATITAGAFAVVRGLA